MGQCKFLMPLQNGKTIIENILTQLKPLSLKQIIIVTQPEYLQVINEILSVLKLDNAQLIENIFPEKERFYSLQLGIKALNGTGFCFIHNADNPVIEAYTLEQLYSNKHKADCIKPQFGKRGGHPILINNKILMHLSKCNPESFLNEEIKIFGNINVEMKNKSILFDLDNQTDYTNFLKHQFQPA